MDDRAPSGPPLERLREGLRRFAADDLDHRIPVAAEEPEGDLAEELNRMAASLRRRRDDVVRAVELYCLRRFGTVLIHDLKNLAARLQFVPGNLRASDGDAEVLDVCASTVEDTADRLLRLVRRFQDQREAMVLRTQGDLNRVVEAAVDRSGLRAAPGFRVELRLGEIPPTLLDEAYLEEAFLNLLRNAMEAMPEGGPIEVETRLEGPQAAVRFSDRGCGMTAGFIERELFEPFRSSKAKGMGLGMFSCRETVELHGGRIEVDSRPGAGTTFRILLPIRTEAA